MGVQTLCARCNGFTAHYYGTRFAAWVGQALIYADRYADRGGVDNRICIPFTIEPLAVLKQIVTMVLAVAPNSSNDAFVKLRRFVLQPFAQWESSDVGIRIYLNPKRSNWSEPQNRIAGASASYDFTTPGKFAFKLADIAFPPLGYVAAISNGQTSPTADFQSLAVVNHFGHHRFRK